MWTKLKCRVITRVEPTSSAYSPWYSTSEPRLIGIWKGFIYKKIRVKQTLGYFLKCICMRYRCFNITVCTFYFIHSHAFMVELAIVKLQTKVNQLLRKWLKKWLLPWATWVAVKLLFPAPFPAKIYTGDEVKLHQQSIFTSLSTNVGQTQSEITLEKYLQYRE